MSVGKKLNKKDLLSSNLATKKGYCTQHINGTMFNVFPINDIEEHIMDSTCWCCPDIIEESGEIIVIHNAFDGRTLKEEQLKKEE